nr:hypothetical protein [Tanacetum cinerariifolium]
IDLLQSPSHEGYMNTIALLAGNNVDCKTLQRYPDVPTTSWRISLRSMDSFQGLTTKSPSSCIDRWLQIQIFYDHVSFYLKCKIGRAAGGKLRDKNTDESWEIIEYLALYNYEGSNDTKEFVKQVKPHALGTTFEARVRDYMAAHTKRMKRFKNAIFMQREEINDRMTEMFGLLKELMTSRAPEKVLIREEAKFPVTKNTETKMPVKEAVKEDEAENAPNRKAKKEKTTEVTYSLKAKESFIVWDPQVVSDLCILKFWFRRNSYEKLFFKEEMEQENIQTSGTTKLPILKQVAQTIEGSLTPHIVGHVTADEKIQKKNDVKARSMLLMALLNEHLMTFNQYKDSKSLFDAITTRFGRNDATRKTQKTLLKQMYENFSAQSTESLDSIFNRLQNIVSQLAVLGESISQEDLNLKFLRILPSEWNTHVVVWRNKSDLDKIKQIHKDDLEEMDLKWQLALLSMTAKRFFQKTDGTFYKRMHSAKEPGEHKQESRNHKRTVNVEDTSSKAMVEINGASFDWSYTADDEAPTNMAFVAFLDSEYDELRVEFNKSECNLANYKRGLALLEEQIVHYKKNKSILNENIVVLKRDILIKDSKIVVLKSKLEKISKEKDDIKIKLKIFENASQSLDKLIRSQITNKSKRGLGYISCNDVPPPHTGRFLPPRIDLSHTGLPEFVEPSVESYRVKPIEVVTQTSSVKIFEPVKENNDAPLIEDWESEGEDEVESPPKIKRKIIEPSVDKVEVDIPKQNDKPARIPVKYAEMYRTQRPRGANTIKGKGWPVNPKSTRRSFQRRTTYNNRNFSQIVNNVKGKVNTARPYSAVLNVVMANKGKADHSHKQLEDQGCFDSRCSRHMTGNISYLTEFKEFDGGYVAFGGGAKGGKITGKGIIRTCKPNFKDVYFVKELKFNLFSVLQMCDKKNSVLFTDTECFILSPDFKLADESHVLLKVTRKNNMYNVDMKNIVPKKDLTCLVAKVTNDESMLWHMRLGHINFKILINLLRKTLLENRVLVVKPHFKTPYELFRGRTPGFSFMRPFGCHVTILNTLDQLGKFDGKSNEGFFIGYSTNSKAFKVYNTRTRKLEENLHINFLENKRIITGTNSNDFTGKRASFNADSDGDNKDNDGPCKESEIDNQERPNAENNTKDVNTIRPSINTASLNINTASLTVNTIRKSDDFFGTDNDMRSLDGVEVDIGNISITYPVPTTLNKRIHKDHSLNNVISDMQFGVQTRKITVTTDEQGFISAIYEEKTHVDLHTCLFACFLSQEEPKRITNALKDPAWLKAMQEELMQFHLQKVWTLVDLHRDKRAIEGIDYDEVFALVARIKSIRLFLAYTSFMGFLVYQMDVKSTFLYGRIKEDVYVCQPLGFEDPDYPDKVYRVEKALYGVHQAPRAWYETLAKYLLDNGFHRGKIDQTLFIKRQKEDILLVQVYENSPSFLGLKVKQKSDGIFISQDNYVDEILRKFKYADVKSASTLTDKEKALLKDSDGDDVDVHLYRSMIGSLMYLTSSRPNIMFVVYSDYAGASLDKKSTSRGCQFLGCRLILWQCKKQTVVAIFTTEVEYMAAASCCGQVLWIQNQLLDYRD